MSPLRDDSLGPLLKLKQELRARGLALRRNLPNHDQLSRRVTERLMRLPEYQAAMHLGVYVGTASEVQTLPVIQSAWSLGKRTAVPCCLGDELELFWIEDLGELSPRTLGILEPKAEIRAMPQRRAPVTSLDLIIVPGVAFDRSGGRLGHGKGYYDRLLQAIPVGTASIALAFACQVFPEVPMLDRDVFVDVVVTESALFRHREY